MAVSRAPACCSASNRASIATSGAWNPVPPVGLVKEVVAASWAFDAASPSAPSTMVISPPTWSEVQAEVWSGRCVNTVTDCEPKGTRSASALSSPSPSSPSASWKSGPSPIRSVCGATSLGWSCQYRLPGSSG